MQNRFKYFKEIVFEQKLNSQRRVPSNDTVVFKNWPEGLTPESLNIVLTSNPRSVGLDGKPRESGLSLKGTKTNIRLFGLISLNN